MLDRSITIKSMDRAMSLCSRRIRRGKLENGIIAASLRMVRGKGKGRRPAIKGCMKDLGKMGKGTGKES
jgi:hypothetical protein